MGCAHRRWIAEHRGGHGPPYLTFPSKKAVHFGPIAAHEKCRHLRDTDTGTVDSAFGAVEYCCEYKSADFSGWLRLGDVIDQVVDDVRQTPFDVVDAILNVTSDLGDLLNSNRSFSGG